MITICKPLLPSKEKEYINNAINTNWVSSNGEYLYKSEEGFSKCHDVKYELACSS